MNGKEVYRCHQRRTETGPEWRWESNVSKRLLDEKLVSVESKSSSHTDNSLSLFGEVTATDPQVSSYFSSTCYKFIGNKITVLSIMNHPSTNIRRDLQLS